MAYAAQYAWWESRPSLRKDYRYNNVKVLILRVYFQWQRLGMRALWEEAITTEYSIVYLVERLLYACTC